MPTVDTADGNPCVPTVHPPRDPQVAVFVPHGAVAREIRAGEGLQQRVDGKGEENRNRRGFVKRVAGELRAVARIHAGTAQQARHQLPKTKSLFSNPSST